MIFRNDEVKRAVQEILEQSEVTRRAEAKRRHDIYKDGGRRFLIEQIRKEFGEDAVTEMRLAPINLLKKIINKRSQVYKKAPQRICELESDQQLLDYYVEELKVNELFQKVNRYYNLLSNTCIYVRPNGDEIKADVVPSYLYSVKANEVDQTKIEGFIFSSFKEDSMIATQTNLTSATGYQTLPLESGFKTTGDLIASQEKDVNLGRTYIFWTDEQHFTTDANGNIIKFNKDLGEEQFINPIGMLPVINVAKDRDNEPWAAQGSDMVDLTMALQLGWSDLLTIAKHQGFSIMTIVSEEEPKKLTIGINKAVWLKQRDNGPTPSITYAQAQSPLSEYKDLLMDLLGLLLSSNDMDVGSISGSTNGAQQFTSGFQQLLSMADNLQAIEADKPVMKSAECDFWDVVSAWHNLMFDANALEEEAKALGKFSDTFEPLVIYEDIKPLESEKETLDAIKELKDMGLISRFDAMKKLHPDLADEEIQKRLDAIDEEVAKRRDQMMATISDQSPKVISQDNQQEADKAPMNES
jgi:hypothetical protein